jgi:translation initiation factor IF-3
VLLIGADNTPLGVVSIREALQQAEEAGMDLVEIQSNKEPPVVKIMDIGKHLYDKKKNTQKRKVVKVKEIKFRPTTGPGDYDVKVRNLRSFLEGGDKVKVTVFFRGREMQHYELGITLLEKVKADLADLSKVEFFPKLEGRQLVMILAPAVIKTT